jgi:hypothetical protein
VHDRRFGVRRIGGQPQRHGLWDEHGVYERELRCVHGGVQLPANQPLSQGHACLRHGKRRLHRHDDATARRNDLRVQSGLPNGNVRVVHGGHGVSAHQCVQDRHDFLRDRPGCLWREREQRGRDDLWNRDGLQRGDLRNL